MGLKMKLPPSLFRASPRRWNLSGNLWEFWKYAFDQLIDQRSLRSGLTLLQLIAAYTLGCRRIFGLIWADLHARAQVLFQGIGFGDGVDSTTRSTVVDIPAIFLWKPNSLVGTAAQAYSSNNETRVG
jgi:hypothetical protein